MDFDEMLKEENISELLRWCVKCAVAVLAGIFLAVGACECAKHRGPRIVAPIGQTEAHPTGLFIAPDPPEKPPEGPTFHLQIIPPLPWDSRAARMPEI